MVAVRSSMSDASYRVLVIDPGSTTTKLGVFTEAGAEVLRTFRHCDADLSLFRGLSTLAQLEYRAALIAQVLEEEGFGAEHFAAVVGRGGLLPPTSCGAYLVDEAMIEALHQARRGDHASNLGGALAWRFAQAAGVNAYIVDPVTVDEWQPSARFSGSPLLPRMAIGHALNIKAVARRFAQEQGRDYAALRLIVIHLGTGITVSAHRDGKMIDNNSPEEGPFGLDRSGA